MTTKFAFIEGQTITKYPVSSTEIKAKFPNTSFPSPISSTDLSSFGVVEVIVEPIPVFDESIQKVVATAPVWQANAWRQGWEFTALSDSERQEYTAGIEAGLRDERASLLKTSDWTQLADASVDKAAWSTYRQELRDLPASAGWPTNVTWPTEPS